MPNVTRIKICGITNRDDARAAIDYGADALGFIGVAESPRFVSQDTVRQIAVDIASLAFCGFFAWKSWILLDEAIVDNFHSGSTWGPPLWIPYSLMTVGMTLLGLQLLIQIVNELRRGRLPA